MAVGTILFLMLQTRDDREVISETLEGLKVGGECVVLTHFCGEKERGVKTQGRTHCQEAWRWLSYGCLSTCGESWHHGFEKGKCERCASATEEGPAVDVAFGGDVHVSDNE